MIFFVAGKPRPAGSKTPMPVRNKAGKIVKINTVDAAKGSKDWKTLVAYTAGAHMREHGYETIRGPVSLKLVFSFKRPKSHYGTGKNADKLNAKGMASKYPLRKPDSTKVLRAAEDGMSGVVYEDDVQVVHTEVDRRWAEIGDLVGVLVDVEEIA